jgi:asparagine synthase (glutamine-hydrolysing)
MHARYIALIASDAEALAASDAAARLRKLDGFDLIFDAGGLMIFAGGTRQMMLSTHGALFGTLFAGREKPRLLDALSLADWAQLSATTGRSLIEGFWGGYVAIVRDDASQAVHVIRAPLGDLPCYYLQNEGLTIVASDVGGLVAAGILQPAINWSFIAGHLLREHFRPSATGLRGVTELLGGTRLTVTAGDTRVEQLWSPWTFAARPAEIADEAIAIEQVRETTLACVNAWGSDFRHIVLGVSGGLDSSIVAACLAHGDTPVTCLTLATQDAGGDERLHARDLATHLGISLHEAFEDLALVDLGRSDAAHLPRPLARAFAQSGDQLSLRLAAQVGGDAFFSGAGGDNVFCYLPSAAPIADRLLAQGVGRGVVRTVRDVSRLTDSSIWKAAVMGMRRAWFRARGHSWPCNRTFLTEEAIARASALGHHLWLDAPAHALPGKAAHIAWLIGIQNHLEGFGRERTHRMVAPLLSQPLVELCLRIPSWMWCSGGRNRSTARSAFARDLPHSIIERRSKGSPGSFVVELYEAHRERVRTLLSDGLLARAGLVDIDSVIAVIDDPRPVRAHHYSRIMALVDVEAWLRAWEEPAKVPHH